jgi:iron complex outermembrane receptor protein
VIAASLLSIFYIDRGGLRTVVLTDRVQFVLMYLGFIVMLAFLVARHGGLAFLERSLPDSHFTWHGGNPPQAILVWYFIALSTLVDPAFWQRAYAARDPAVARRAVLWSVGFWILFDFLTTTTGMYARALLPTLERPVFAFPELAGVTLPPGALGLFYLAMIATVMSTIDSYGFIAAATVGRDLIWRLRREVTEERLPTYTRVGLWIAGAFAAALALGKQSVIALWHDLGSITTPTLLLPVGLGLAGRACLPPAWTLAAMIVPLVVTLYWVGVEALPAKGAAPAYPWSIEPIYAGLAASLLVYTLGWIVRYTARSGGAHPPNAAGGATIMKTLVSVAVLVMTALHAAAASAADTSATSDTLTKVVPLSEIVVSTTRVGEGAPFARSVLGRDEIQRRNWGQDTPMALATLPGAYAYSDAGNGIGYSYLSIRGFPQRRISVLVNGVPLNDPESHEVYWIDHPDLLASTAEVQVQRGVGSALYGAASVGGSVHLETAPFDETPRARIGLGYGSYETKRLMLESSSGRLANGWNLYGRYSRIETFGYREQSWSKLWSYALSARRLAGNHSLRVNLYGGPEETHLAYLGVPKANLDGAISGDREQDRRVNPITYKNERDHFFEPHFELIHSWSPSPSVALTQTLFYFDGKGYYEEQRFGRSLSEFRLAPWTTADSTLLPPDYYAGTRVNDTTYVFARDSLGRFTVERFDVVRRRTIANRHYGWVPRLRIEHAGGALTLGGELRAHDGRHWGQVESGNGLPPGTPPDHTYYDYHPRTLSGGLFMREEWRPAERLLVTGDLGWRHQSYYMRGDQFDAIRFDQPYDFALPRLGVTYTPRDNLSAFAAWSYSEREPAFRDLYDAESPGSIPLYRHVDVAQGIYEDPLIKPERVSDLELGGSWRGSGLMASAHFFRMDFRDELVYGAFNADLGYPILGNAAQSVHQGIEIAGRAEGPIGGALHGWIDANATLSDNHFVNYRETTYDFSGNLVENVYDGNAIGFFPATLANLGARVTARGATLGAQVQHAGRIFLDHNENDRASIEPRTVLNLTASYRFGLSAVSQAELGLRVFNVLDQEYETGGYMDFDADGTLSPRFIPAAKRNLLAELRIDF